MKDPNIAMFIYKSPTFRFMARNTSSYVSAKIRQDTKKLKNKDCQMICRQNIAVESYLMTLVVLCACILLFVCKTNLYTTGL